MKYARSGAVVAGRHADTPCHGPRGMPRFFRRLAEGVFDIEDLKFRTYELADFVQQATKVYGFDLEHLVTVGYSNGANIATSELLLRPAILASAILFSTMVPLVPDVMPDFSTKHVFISAGLHDPIVPRQETKDLFTLLKKAGVADISINWQNSEGLVATCISPDKKN